MPEQLPPPLPPETRTVGQLVAETIRLYQRRFWPSLALGVAPAALAVGGSFLDRPGQATLAIGGGSLLLSATYVRACVLTSTDHPTRDSILRAWVVGALVWLLVPVLILAFVLPAVAWLGLVGGPLIIVSGTAVMFTGNQPSSTLHSLQAIMTAPEFLWELFLGIYCTIWGFRRDAPILSRSAR